jgi:hypothetical protein
VETRFNYTMFWDLITDNKAENRNELKKHLADANSYLNLLMDPDFNYDLINVVLLDLELLNEHDLKVLSAANFLRNACHVMDVSLLASFPEQIRTIPYTDFNHHVFYGLIAGMRENLEREKGIKSERQPFVEHLNNIQQNLSEVMMRKADYSSLPDADQALTMGGKTGEQLAVDDIEDYEAEENNSLDNFNYCIELLRTNQDNMDRLLLQLAQANVSDYHQQRFSLLKKLIVASKNKDFAVLKDIHHLVSSLDELTLMLCAEYCPFDPFKKPEDMFESVLGELRQLIEDKLENCKKEKIHAISRKPKQRNSKRRHKNPLTQSTKQGRQRDRGPQPHDIAQSVPAEVAPFSLETFLDLATNLDQEENENKFKEYLTHADHCINLLQDPNYEYEVVDSVLSSINGVTKDIKTLFLMADKLIKACLKNNITQLLSFKKSISSATLSELDKKIFLDLIKKKREKLTDERSREFVRHLCVLEAELSAGALTPSGKKFSGQSQSSSFYSDDPISILKKIVEDSPREFVENRIYVHFNGADQWENLFNKNASNYPAMQNAFLSFPRLFAVTNIYHRLYQAVKNKNADEIRASGALLEQLSLNSHDKQIILDFVVKGSNQNTLSETCNDGEDYQDALNDLKILIENKKAEDGISEPLALTREYLVSEEIEENDMDASLGLMLRYPEELFLGQEKITQELNNLMSVQVPVTHKRKSTSVLSHPVGKKSKLDDDQDYIAFINLLNQDPQEVKDLLNAAFIDVDYLASVIGNKNFLVDYASIRLGLEWHEDEAAYAEPLLVAYQLLTDDLESFINRLNGIAKNKNAAPFVITSSIAALSVRIKDSEAEKMINSGENQLEKMKYLKRQFLERLEQSERTPGQSSVTYFSFLTPSTSAAQQTSKTDGAGNRKQHRP